MKHTLFKMALISALTFSLSACSSDKPTGSNASDAPKQQASKTKIEKAEDVINAFKGEGLPIGNQIAYTAENDPNKLLGRPGQYTSKVNFADTKIKKEGDSIGVANGGSVEMFANEQDAKNRFDYVSKIAKSSPMFAEYDYLSGKIVLRVSNELTPDQATAYENALKKISK